MIFERLVGLSAKGERRILGRSIGVVIDQAVLSKVSLVEQRHFSGLE